MELCPCLVCLRLVDDEGFGEILAHRIRILRAEIGLERDVLAKDIRVSYAFLPVLKQGRCLRASS